MAPEQGRGDPIDARSDLYALGCILHLMLTATPPFAASTREQMIKRRLTEEAPHVQALDPGLPDSVDRIAERLLARSPADRYGSAAEVRDALAGTHARRAPVNATPHATLDTPRSAPTMPFASAAIAPTEVTEVAALPPRVRPRPHAASIALAVILVVGGALVVRGARSGGDQLVPPLGSEQSADSAARDTTSTLAVVAPPTGAKTGAPITVPPIVVAKVDSPKPKVAAKPVDSAAIRARIAQRREADSLARLAEAVPTPVKDAIARYANAIESLSVDKLKEAYPNLTSKQQEMWEKSVFGIATSVNTSVRYGAITKTDEKADVDFTLNVSFRYANGTRGSMPPQRQHATLLKTPSGWQIVEIK
jgi:hypothetical protein